jgi:hypothetical protein
MWVTVGESMKIRWLVMFLVSVGFLGCSDTFKRKDPAEQPDDNGQTRVNNTAPDLGMSGGGSSDMGSEEGADLGLLPDGGQCQPGVVRGCADDTTQAVCNDGGDGVVERACPDGEWCLFGECGDQRCQPGTLHCQSPEMVETCNADGTGYEDEQPCPDNTICEQGTCKSICDLGGKGPSYIGCEYWTVDLDQYTDPSTNPKPDEVPHAVVISNPGPADSTLSFVPRGPGVSVNVPDPVVPVGEARVFEMPRWDVSGSSLSFKAIQIIASSPVIAHQFNPFNNENVYSNDASLLLPVTAQGKEYYVVNWPTQVLPSFQGFNPEDQHSYVTIVATTPGDTNINVTPTAQIVAGDGVPNFSPGATRSISMRYGQVLNLQANSGDVGGANDLSGTRILADQPVAVFAGHEEAVIGNAETDRDSCCADHLEQQLFPVEAWGTEYIATRSPDRGDSEDHWKIVAAEDGVTVNFNPPQNGAASVQLDRGEVTAFYSKESFEVQASGKISIGQFLVSQEQTLDVTGDPAMILTVPSNQFRTDYHLLTPQGYTEDFVVVTRPAGIEVRLDGAAIAEGEFSPVGAGNWETATVRVEPGLHVLDGDEEFGLQAYGFNNAVSYGYPGGLNLVGVDEPPTGQ